MNGILNKVKTKIAGLDRLLYGGLDLQEPKHIIAIRGDVSSERTLLGLQILYGLTQSITLCETSNKTSDKKIPDACFVSSCMETDMLNDMLLDMVISSSIQELMVKYVSSNQAERASITNIMAELFFKEVDYAESSNKATIEIANSRIMSLVQERTDYLLGKEVLYYSNRTNCIHFRSANGPDDEHADSDENNKLFERRYSNVMEYFNKEQSRINTYNAAFKSSFVPITIDKEENVYKYLSSKKANCEKLLAIDLDDSFDGDAKKSPVSDLINTLRDVQCNAKVCILIVPNHVYIPEHMIDMIIDLKTILKDTYVYRYLTFTKSRRQFTALGYHLYKRRDYGIEIFPSIQTYFEHRRYLQRALVYTHSPVLCDTYQQYIDKNRNTLGTKVGYKDYMDNRDKQERQYLMALYPRYNKGMSSVDVLDRILLSQPISYDPIQGECSGENILEYQGSVTAIIGEPNTYKRFLTFGSVFSSSLNKEHTLMLLLNKDDATIRRRLSCPARAEHDKEDPKCKHCYQYIHFMDICMGNISPDEFLYYLVRQLDTCYNDGKKIKRIVIDDLQIVDYCFPLLGKKGNMFLPALASVCRDRNIMLYILCDKQCESVEELRAVADNIICTNRDESGLFQMHIERYVGYNNTPSRIYSCHVKKAKELFECYERIDDDDVTKSYFELNNSQIESVAISTMKNFWRK